MSTAGAGAADQVLQFVCEKYWELGLETWCVAPSCTRILFFYIGEGVRRDGFSVTAKNIVNRNDLVKFLIVKIAIFGVFGPSYVRTSIVVGVYDPIF